MAAAPFKKLRTGMEVEEATMATSLRGMEVEEASVYDTADCCGRCSWLTTEGAQQAKLWLNRVGKDSKESYLCNACMVRWNAAQNSRYNIGPY